MNCKDVQPLISKMLDGAVSDDEEKLALDHLSACDPCKKRYADMDRITKLITESLSSHPFNDRLVNHTLNLLPSRRLPVISGRKRSGLVRWVAAAAAVVIIALGLALTFTGPEKGPVEVATAESETLDLEVGMNELRDGSTIDLWKGGSGAVTYGKNGTEVSLESGTLHARVTKQKEGKEFRVVATDLKVVVIGTEFFVEIADSGTICTVREGRVKCVPRRNTKAAKFVYAGHAYNSSRPRLVTPVTVFPTASSAVVEPAPAEPTVHEPVQPSIGEPEPALPFDRTGDNAVNTDMPIGGTKKKKK